ncbi:MAG TPA: PA2779 family protein [Syntrophales bacterium]|nr:PA2779 family protein [Syntrophales bacterium]
MIRTIRKPVLAVCLSIYLLCLFSTPAIAGMIGSVASSDAYSDRGVRETEIGKIQRALETEIVNEKLKAYGLTPDEINAKLTDLTDEQIHTLAQASDHVLAGADDGLGVVIAILLIVLIVILILKLSGKSVFVR